MNTLTDFLRRSARATGRALLVLGQVIADLPVTCFRCKREFRFGDGAVKPLHDIPEHRGKSHFFCGECAVAIRAEYRYTCAQCGERHNLTNSPICADCIARLHPREAKRVADQNMRALEYGVPAILTVPEWLQTLDDFGWSCYCCGEPFEALDHYVPLARGGGTTADNCFPICRKHNSMKGALHPDELLQPSPRPPEVHRRIREYQQARWTPSSGSAPVLHAPLDETAI